MIHGSYRNIMVASAALAAGFGLGFLLAPGPLSLLYGLALDRAGEFVARLLGVEFLGYGLLAWSFRNAPVRETRRGILLAFFLTDAAGGIVALSGQLAGLLNPLGWSIVGTFLLLASAFGYLLLRPPALSPSSEAEG